MKIKTVFTFDERARRAIRRQINDDGKPASHEECARWIDSVINSTLEVLCAELDEVPAKPSRTTGRES